MITTEEGLMLTLLFNPCHIYIIHRHLMQFLIKLLMIFINIVYDYSILRILTLHNYSKVLISLLFNIIFFSFLLHNVFVAANKPNPKRNKTGLFSKSAQNSMQILSKEH